MCRRILGRLTNCVETGGDEEIYYEKLNLVGKSTDSALTFQYPSSKENLEHSVQLVEKG